MDPDTGEVAPCEVLVCVLPYSGLTYAEALPWQHADVMAAILDRFLPGAHRFELKGQSMRKKSKAKN